MKKLFISLFLISAFAVTTQAQNPGIYTALSGGTNFVAGNATNTYSLTQSVSEFDNVGIQVGFNLAGGVGMPATNTVTFKFYGSLDGTSYDNTAPIFSFTVVPVLTNTTFVTNFNIPALATIGNFTVAQTNSLATASVTNLTVKYRLKAAKKRSL